MRGTVSASVCGEPVTPPAKFLGTHFPFISTSDLNAISSSTIVFELANGIIVIGNGMWWADAPAEVNTEDGSLEVKFEGDDVTEN